MKGRYFTMKEVNLKKCMKLYGEGATAELKNSSAYRAIIASIAEAEGRSRERTITPEDIFFELERIESAIPVPKKHLEGTSVDCDINGRRLPNAYKHAAYSTHFTACYRSGAWRLTSITRDYLRSSDLARVTLSDATKQALVARFSRI